MSFGIAEFAKEVQTIRNSLVYLDTLALSARYQDHVRISKGLILVWMSASVEKFWKSYLSELCQRVAVAPPHKRRRHLAAASIFYFDTLASMGEGKRLRRWDKAAEFFEQLPSPLHNPVAIPYDGRTLRPEHVFLVWRLFSLEGDAFPSPIHRQDLSTLADQRNDVAHGLVEPAQVGGTLTLGDLSSRLTRLEDLVIHCISSADKRWKQPAVP